MSKSIPANMHNVTAQMVTHGQVAPKLSKAKRAQATRKGQLKRREKGKLGTHYEESVRRLRCLAEVRAVFGSTMYRTILRLFDASETRDGLNVKLTRKP